jgi:hypothetical protein
MHERARIHSPWTWSMGQLTKFTLPELIEEELNKVFRQLAEKYLAGLQRREFARKVAALLSEINPALRVMASGRTGGRQGINLESGGVRSSQWFSAAHRSRLLPRRFPACAGDPFILPRHSVKFVQAQGVELNYSEKIGPAKGLSHGGKITLLSGMHASRGIFNPGA